MKYKLFKFFVLLISVVFICISFGTNTSQAQSCPNPGPADANYQWAFISSNCQSAGSYGNPLCSWSGGTCDAVSVGSTGFFEEYSGPPIDITYCNTSYTCVYNPPSSCSIDSFTADDTTPPHNTSTTLRFSLNGSYLWSISLLEGSVLPSPDSGTGSSALTTGNLTTVHTYRLTCGLAIRDLTVVPENPTTNLPPASFSIWGNCFGWPTPAVEINAYETVGDTYTIQKRGNVGGWQDLVVNYNFFDFDHYADYGVSSGGTYDYRVIKSNAYGSTVSDNVDVYTIDESSCGGSVPPPTCDDPGANNFGGPLPCTYGGLTCEDPSANNYGGPLPCTYIPTTPTYKVSVGHSFGGKVVSVPLGSGIDCGLDCENNYEENSTVILRAIPSSAYWKFSYWTGSCSSFTTQECSIKVDGDKSTSAIFVARKFIYSEF